MSIPKPFLALFVKKGEEWFWNGHYENGNADPGYRELYVRWLQYGVFLPIFRSHGTDCRREPWNFGDKGDPFYDANSFGDSSEISLAALYLLFGRKCMAEEWDNHAFAGI